MLDTIDLLFTTTLKILWQKILNQTQVFESIRKYFKTFSVFANLIEGAAAIRRDSFTFGNFNKSTKKVIKN